MQLAVKQYVPLEKPAKSTVQQITIIGAHANGFPKVDSTAQQYISEG